MALLPDGNTGGVIRKNDGWRNGNGMFTQCIQTGHSTSYPTCRNQKFTARNGNQRGAPHNKGRLFNRPEFGHVAPTQVATHGAVDVRVGRIGRITEQRQRLHDLTGLTEAALGHAFIDPSLLQGMQTAVLAREPLNG